MSITHFIINMQEKADVQRVNQFVYTNLTLSVPDLKTHNKLFSQVKLGHIIKCLHFINLSHVSGFPLRQHFDLSKLPKESEKLGAMEEGLHLNSNMSTGKK